MNIIRTAKYLGFYALLFLMMLTTQAQYNHVGFYGTVNDYTGDLNNNDFGLFRYKCFKPGLAVSFEQYVSPIIDAVETFSYDWVQYENELKTTGVDAQFLSFDFKFRLKCYKELPDAPPIKIAPFFELGAGGTYIKSRQFINDKPVKNLANDSKFNLVGGTGLTFRLNDAVDFEIASRVYMPLYDGWDGITKGGDNIWSNDINVQHSAGFRFKLRKSIDSDHDGVSDGRNKCPNTPQGIKVNGKGCPIDRDGDGVPDYLDKCPTVFGSITLDGCPDRDNDYVADNEDACPDVPGLVSNHGCPLKDYNNFKQNNNQQEADSDGDGVPDSKDNCPNTPRGTPVDEYGCPRKDQNDKDSDGDGVPDAVDRCPFSAGPASNKGCPEIKEAVKKKLEFATKGIYFETNKAIIKPISYSKLNQIVKIVNDYPDYDVRLSGHTDNVGSDDYNLNLSQNRVDAVKAYLVNNGINANRISAIGYGKTMPVASNNSEVGKALNRRVEIELFLN